MLTCDHDNRVYYAKDMCRNCYYRQWRMDNPEKARRSVNNARLKKVYGIDLNEYEDMLIRQGYLCLICGDKLLPGFRTHIDHNHTTGRVRGILCHSCNVAIGFMREDIRIAKRILEYLEGDQSGT